MLKTTRLCVPWCLGRKKFVSVSDPLVSTKGKFLGPIVSEKNWDGTT